MAAVTPYLLVENLTKSVGSKVLFSNISFSVNKGQHIAIIARNGIGKSTLMDILMGKTDYDDGKITWRNDLKVKYLPQKLSLDEAMSLLGSKIKQDDFQKLSGGQQKKLLIEQVLADEPDLILLDEPTNHLDLESITALNKGLINYKGNLLLTSHDQELMQTVANRIIEINDVKTYDRQVTYDEYVDETMVSN